MDQLCYKFFIPGFDHSDIYQEALYALRYKAIKDYDKNRGRDKPYPFEKFASLCIRRHLSTQLKSSYQNKKKVLNCSVSLDQDRNDYNTGDILYLIDILSNGNHSILNNLEEKEYFQILFDGLFQKLSKFEKNVFKLYIQKHSYEDISKILNKKYKKQKIKTKVNVKSIDNAISRIKMKGKEVFLKHGKK